MQDVLARFASSSQAHLRGARIGVVTAAAIAALLLLGWAAGLFSSSEPESDREPYSIDGDAVTTSSETTQRISFRTAAARLEASLPVPPLTGRVVTVQTRTARSFAPLAGRVADVRVRLGDHVAKGAKLVLVHTAELPSLQRDLLAAELSVRTKEALVDRTRMMVDSRAASQNDLMIAQSKLQQARLEAQAAAAKLQSFSVVQEGESAYWLIASRAGAIVELEAEPGMQVGPDRSDPLATIADLDEVVVVGDLPQRDAAGVEIGLPATIRLPGRPEETLSGRIESVSEVVDPERQTVPIRVRVENPGHLLRPNAYVELEVAPKSDEPLVQVPAAAVLSDGSRAVVFVETSPGTFRRRPVEVGRQTRETVEIKSGLAAGEPVVVDGALLLLNAIDVER